MLSCFVPLHSSCNHIFFASTVHYNAYLEYSEEPFDSSILRNYQERFKLGSGMLQNVSILKNLLGFIFVNAFKMNYFISIEIID